MKAKANYITEADQLVACFFTVDVEETDRIEIKPTTTANSQYMATIANAKDTTQAVIYLYKAQMKQLLLEFFN